MKQILISIILTGLVSFLIQQNAYLIENKIQMLDMHTEINENYLSKPNFPKSNIELKVDGVNKDQLGLLTISFFNYSKKNLSKSSVRIIVTPDDIKDFDLVSYFAVGEKQIPNLLKEVEKVEFNGQSFIFNYEIDFINRTDKIDYSIQLKIMYEGSNDINVEAVAEGIGIRKYNKNNMPYNRKTNIQAILLLLSMFLVIISISIISSFIYSKLFRGSKQKLLNNELNKIYKIMRNDLKYTEISDDELKKRVSNLEYKKDLFDWNNKSKFSKFLDGFYSPDNRNYTL